MAFMPNISLFSRLTITLYLHMSYTCPCYEPWIYIPLRLDHTPNYHKDLKKGIILSISLLSSESYYLYLFTRAV